MEDFCSVSLISFNIQRYLEVKSAFAAEIRRYMIWEKYEEKKTFNFYNHFKNGSFYEPKMFIGPCWKKKVSKSALLLSMYSVLKN